MDMTMTHVGVADLVASDPSKHVNYTFGMVLGVDDFNQEFAWLSERDRWLARDLLGYGTVWGLAVSTEPDPADTSDPTKRARVTVDRGVGLTPRGELVCVPAMQCAYLAPWLRTHADEVRGVLASDGDLSLYVVLCYRERKTDNVPIPGEPCRSEDDLMAPSRLQDDFSLELRVAPPPQCEEDAVRDFVAWLRAVPIASPGSSLAAFEAEIRAAALPAPGSPPIGSPPIGSPPIGSPPIGSPPAQGAQPCAAMLHPPIGVAIPPDAVTEYLRAAFRIWATEIRPRWRLDLGCGAACEPQPDAGCLLLAELVVPITWEVGPTQSTPIPGDPPFDVREDRRPFVLSERVLQEWLLSGGGGEPLTGSPPDTGSPPVGSPPFGGPTVIAAARVSAGGDVTTQPYFTSGGLTVTKVGPVHGAYALALGPQPIPAHVAITATAVRTNDTKARNALVAEVVFDKELLGAVSPDLDGPFVYIRDADNESADTDFMVVLTQVVP